MLYTFMKSKNYVIAFCKIKCYAAGKVPAGIFIMRRFGVSEDTCISAPQPSPKMGQLRVNLYFMFYCD